VPAAVSLLADLFEPSELPFPVSIFTGGVSIGAGLALVLGGSLIAYATHGVQALPLAGPWLAGLHPWETVFLLVGSAGFPIVLATLLIPEPIRRSNSLVQAQRGFSGVLAHLKSHRGMFVKLLGGVGLLTIVTSAVLAWSPSIFVRSFGWKPAEVGAALGVPVMLCGLTGIFGGGFVAQYLARRWPGDAAFRVMSNASLFLLVPIATLAPLSPNPHLALAGVALTFFAGAASFGVMSAAFVAVTPQRLRGQMVAISLLVANVLGLGLGPYSVGFLLDHVFHNPAKVGLALAAVALCAGLPGALLLRSARAGYRMVAAGVLGKTASKEESTSF